MDHLEIPRHQRENLVIPSITMHNTTTSAEGLRRVRFWDSARVGVLLCLRADPRGETAAGLARRLDGQCMRSAVYMAANHLLAEGLVSAGTSEAAVDLQAIDDMLAGRDPTERTLQLTDAGMTIADLLLTVLREQFMRVLAKLLNPQQAHIANWSKQDIAEFVEARPQRAAGLAYRHGYPMHGLTEHQRQLVHRTVVLVARHETATA